MKLQALDVTDRNFSIGIGFHGKHGPQLFIYLMLVSELWQLQIKCQSAQKPCKIRVWSKVFHMPCEKYVQLKREFESIANEVGLFKTPFCAGGTKKERDKALQGMQEEHQQAFIAYANHEENCPDCQALKSTLSANT